MRSSFRQALGLVAASGLLFFAALGSVDLWDEDEPIFAGAAREMMARQEWIVPYFNEQMLPDKPVLSYWVMIAGYKLFGQTEFAARAGSALFSVGTVLLTWLLGRRMFSPRAGVWAGLVLASSFSFLIVARAATPDAVLTFFSTLSIVAYVWSLPAAWPHMDNTDTSQARQPLARRFALAGSYAAMGMAVLAKGPIGVLLPMATIGLYSLLAIPVENETRRDRTQAGWLATLRQFLFDAARRLHPRCLLAAMKPMHPFLGIAVVLAVAGPWYLAVGLRTDGAWLAGFLGKHNLERFLHPMEHHRGPFYYYPLAALIGFFPWSLFVGATGLFVRSRLREAGGSRPIYRLLLCWIVVYLMFFSMAATKLPNYIIPIYPALALLTAAWLDVWLSGACVVRPFLLRTAWVLLTAAGLGISIVLPLVARHFFGDGTSLAVVGVPLVAGGLLCWWWHARCQRVRTAAIFAASVGVFWLLLFGFGAVEVGRYQTSRQFADAIARHSFTTAPTVRTFRYWRPSLVYYLGRHVEPLHGEEHLRSFCRRWPAGGFLLVPDDEYSRVAGFLPHDVTVIERGEWFLKKKQLLLLGRGMAESRMGSIAWQIPSPH